jgi:hypothetical protein
MPSLPLLSPETKPTAIVANSTAMTANQRRYGRRLAQNAEIPPAEAIAPWTKDQVASHLANAVPLHSVALKLFRILDL